MKHHMCIQWTINPRHYSSKSFGVTWYTLNMNQLLVTGHVVIRSQFYILPKQVNNEYDDSIAITKEQ